MWMEIAWGQKCPPSFLFNVEMHKKCEAQKPLMSVLQFNNFKFLKTTNHIFLMRTAGLIFIHKQKVELPNANND